jgi:iron complex outermembrane receptor protein
MARATAAASPVIVMPDMPAQPILLALLAAAPIDVIVVTGTRIPQAQLDVPAALTLVPAEQILDGQWRVNASEALMRVPGLVVRNRENYAQDLQVSARGFGARAAFGVRGVRLLADGIPASMPDGQGQAATFNLDVAERFEVLRGPFAAMYGNHAGGVIQLFTRSPSDVPLVALSLLGGSDATRKWDLNASGKAGATGYLLDASRFDTEGYRAHSAARREQAFAKLVRGRLTLTASSLVQKNTQDPLGVTWSAWLRDPRAIEPNLAQRFNTRKHIHHVQAGLRYDAGPLQLTAFGGNRRVEQFQSFTPAFQASPSHSGGVVDFDRDFHGADLHWTTRWGQAEMTVGAEAEYAKDQRTGYENFIGAQLGVRGRLRRDEDDVLRGAAAYTQGRWQLGELSLHAALRHSRLTVAVRDRFTSNGNDSGEARFSRTTPMAGLSYRLPGRASLYASLAGGFETPTLNELFYSNSGPGLNLGLRPATSRHGEFGYKGARLQLAFFNIRTKDELAVASAAGGRTVYRNAGNTRRSGMEFSYGVDWRAGLASTFSMASLHARRDGLRLPGVPGHTGFADLRWKPARACCELALEWHGASKTYADEGNRDTPAPGYGALTLRASSAQQWGPWRLKETIRAQNLMDKQYIGSVIVGDANKRYYEPAPGRQFMVGLTLERSL